MINGERAAYHAPAFRPKITRTRSQILKSCGEALQDKKPLRSSGSVFPNSPRSPSGRTSLSLSLSLSFYIFLDFFYVFFLNFFFGRTESMDDVSEAKTTPTCGSCLVYRIIVFLTCRSCIVVLLFLFLFIK